MLTVAVLQQKGGVGKTTLAINLAAAAHLERKRTLLIDLDRQASAFDWSAARQDGSSLEGIAVVQAVARRPSAELSPTRLGEMTRGYDVVILDGPARLDGVMQSAAVWADVVLLPALPGPFDFWAMPETRECLDQADELRATIGRPPVRRAFVINRFDGSTLIGREAEQAMRESGASCIGCVRQRVAFPVAASRGESVFTLPAAEDAAHDIARLWRALKEGNNGPQRQAQPRARARTRQQGEAGREAPSR